MTDIRNIYNHWAMQTTAGTNIVHFGAIWGIFIGACICLLINCCASSCSRKTTQVQTESDIHTSAVTDSMHTDSSCSTIDIRKYSQIVSDSESSLESQWIRIMYEYDSLGNRRIASEESATIKSNSHRNDSSNDSAFTSATFIITHTDTVHDADNTESHNKNNTVTYNVPWYWKLGTYIGTLISGCVLFGIVFLVLKRKRK